MRKDWLKTGAFLSAAGGLWLWMSPAPPSLKPSRDASVGVAEPGRPASAKLALESRPPDAGVLTAKLEADGKKGLRPLPARKFRKLPAKRDPRLEADPEFQKLLELDSTRKMALVQSEARHDDPDAAQQALADAKASKISRRVLEQALIDPNAEVRLAALFEISLEFDEPPLELLAPLVESDPNADVRLEALEMVGDSDSLEAETVIQGALGDPDDEVRARAEDLLDTAS